MNFMTVGDHHYYYTIHKCAEGILNSHPESEYYVYDWGLKDDQISKLEELKNTKVIRWNLDPPSKKESISLYLLNEWMDGSEGLIWRIKRKLLKQTPVHKYFRSRQKYLMRQKPLCIKDGLQRSSGQLVFLDADAVLISRITEVFDQEFDVGLTLRPENKRPDDNESIGIPPINAGVIFFGSSDVDCFIDAWIKQMDDHDYILEEQVAIADMAKKSNKDIFNDYYNKGSLTIDNKKIDFITFPCDKYNHYHIDEGISTDNKILHFKGFDHTKGEYKKVLERGII